MKDQERAERLLERYRREAILLHQPYPPPFNSGRNSHFGGLPAMPDNMAWPRTSTGAPLHFLAQIDCAELPPLGQLPDHGFLLFFGRDDEEQIWNHDGPAHDDCRVLFMADATSAISARPAPADLPPIGDCYPRPYAKPFLKKGEFGPNIHPEWPVVPLHMSSWPNFEALPEYEIAAEPVTFWKMLTQLLRTGSAMLPDPNHERRQLVGSYWDSLDFLRANAFYSASGLPDLSSSEHLADVRKNAATALWGWIADPDAFPARWVDVDLFAHAATALSDRLERIVAGAVQEAEAWIRRAEREAPAAKVPILMKREFRKWVGGWKNPESPLPFHYFVESILLDVGRQIVRLEALQPDMSASSFVRSTMAPLFAPRRGDSPSQMLGYPPTSQHPRAADDPAICLLSLTSASPIGWMFGDMGECTFWIEPDDLARRDFSRAWATIEGG